MASRLAADVTILLRRSPADVTEHIRMDVQTDIGHIVKMFASNKPDDLADLASGMEAGDAGKSVPVDLLFFCQLRHIVQHASSASVKRELVLYCSSALRKAIRKDWVRLKELLERSSGRVREIDAGVRARFVTQRFHILKPLFRSRFERSESTKSTCATSCSNPLNLSDCISITRFHV
jgi:hypothetical protein